jgi:predicted TIM-barrel fold metal-dependent hydrolase
MWASDWPHWDWDPPSRVWDLPFLDEDARRGILGGNAAQLFKLDHKLDHVASVPS